MKAKTLSLLLAAASISMAVAGHANAAGGWTLAADSAEGNTRYLVNSSALEYRTNKHGVDLFSVPVRAVTNGQTKDFYAVVGLESCLENGGDLILGSDANYQRYWWSGDGNRMYDSLAGKICQIAGEKAANKTLNSGGSAKPTRNYY